ncbi:MAG TPA: hypothetical protein VHY09_07045 [Candidatus Methylacidiphilales bacterium]|jgi:mRNA-degrading endonuclease RelE of RelBE toxin-antitoxin system|nr:hypothetical protein [Candidatus Methylacidiphilales bacterium]
MKPFELLLAYKVVEFARQLNRSDRNVIEKAFKSLEESPHNCKDLTERHLSGREHFVLYRGKFAIKFWIDDWEREVKVMKIQLRDSP